MPVEVHGWSALVLGGKLVSLKRLGSCYSMYKSFLEVQVPLCTATISSLLLPLVLLPLISFRHFDVDRSSIMFHCMVISVEVMYR